MRKVVLFIAMSLDGYIADAEGRVDWLEGQDREAEDEDTYSVFAKEIDTVVMGWNTYHQVVTELSPNEWVYKEFTSYVITHRQEESPDPNIVFYHGTPGQLIRQLRGQEGKAIWICGGAEIVGQLMEEELIDRFHISIIPTLLGKGIRLFGELGREWKLKLLKTESYNGITEVIYERRA